MTPDVFTLGRMNRVELIATWLQGKRPREIEMAGAAARVMTDSQIAAVILREREEGNHSPGEGSSTGRPGHPGRAS